MVLNNQHWREFMLICQLNHPQAKGQGTFLGIGEFGDWLRRNLKGSDESDESNIDRLREFVEDQEFQGRQLSQDIEGEIEIRYVEAQERMAVLKRSGRKPGDLDYDQAYLEYKFAKEAYEKQKRVIVERAVYQNPNEYDEHD